MLLSRSQLLRYGPWVAALLFGITMFAWAWWRWWTFQYTTFDLAFYVQGLWCAVRGEWVATLLDVPLLGNHAEPIVFLLLPLFAICPHPMLLVGVQAAALASMPLCAWRICQRLGLNEKESLLLSLCTVLTPATAWASLHEFHPETLSAPLVLALFNERLAGRRTSFWAFWLLLAGCKENLALMLVGWGVLFAWLERRRGWRHALEWNLVPAGVAGLWLATSALWLAPWLNGGKVAYGELYSHLGRSGLEVFGGFFTDPSRAGSALLRAGTQGNLLGGILLPWLGLAILRPRWLLIAAPLILQHLLSWRSSEWSIRFHYGAPLVALTWIALAEAVTRLPRRSWWCWFVLVGSVVGQMVVGPAKELLPQELADASRRLALRKVQAIPLKEIDSDSSVIASNGYLPHLACRRELHSLHHLIKGLKTLSRAEYVPPKTVGIVLADYTDTTTFDSPAGFYHPQMRTSDGRTIASSDALFDTYLLGALWTRHAVNGISLFRRFGESSTATALAEPEPLAIKEPRWAGQAAKGTLQFALSYTVTQRRTNYPWGLIVFSRGDDRFLIQLGLLAAGAHPGESTETWDIYWPPNAPPGAYRSTLIVYDHNRASWEKRSPLSMEDTTQFELGEIQVQ